MIDDSEADCLATHGQLGEIHCMGHSLHVAEPDYVIPSPHGVIETKHDIMESLRLNVILLRKICTIRTQYIT